MILARFGESKKYLKSQKHRIRAAFGARLGFLTALGSDFGAILGDRDGFWTDLGRIFARSLKLFGRIRRESSEFSKSNPLKDQGDSRKALSPANFVRLAARRGVSKAFRKLLKAFERKFFESLRKLWDAFDSLSKAVESFPKNQALRIRTTRGDQADLIL